MAHRLFNTPLECGFRMLFVLDAAAPQYADLQRLINSDYLLVHSGDVEGGPTSLHPAVPYRGSELLVKRQLVSSGLDLMFARELIEKSTSERGIMYRGTSLTSAFIRLLKAPYASQLAARARWLHQHFGEMSDNELEDFMTMNVGRWGAEFERLTALHHLEL